jgi:hypothetical protein
MASLLETFFSPENSQGNMALFANMIGGNLPQGLLSRSQIMADRPTNDLKRLLLKSQVEENQAQSDERKQKTKMARDAQERQDRFLFGDSSGAAPGAFAPSAGGVGSTGQAPAQGGLLAQARALGIPESAIQADILFNGGKKVAEFIEKRGTPSMKVSNGYAYDENRIAPGFLPQVNIARDGQASMVQIGPDGLPVVSAPQGAYQTYAGYKSIEESNKANFDPVTVTPQGQNPQMTTRGAIVRNPQVQGRIDPQVQAIRDSERKTILEAEMEKAKVAYNSAIANRDQSAAARAQADMAALSRELGLGSPTVGMPLQSEEEKLRANEGAKGDAAIAQDLTKQASQSRDVVTNINRARELLNRGPTASGVGSLVDKGLAVVGQSTPGADIASALDNVSGWLTSNVPRMEGPQSNFDVENYKIMAGRVGDRTLPVSQRAAALDELERMQKKYERFNGPNTGSTDPSRPNANIVDTLPKSAPRGTRARDTKTGEVKVFNGLTWVKER